MTKPIDSDKTRRRWTAVEARAVLAAKESSGLSDSAFAAREGLDSQRLRVWRRKLGGVPKSRPTFVEVGPQLAERVEIVLRSGVILRVAESIDSDRLHNIVAALDKSSQC